MKKVFLVTILFLVIYAAKSQDTTAFSGRKLSLKQNTTDSVLLSIKSRVDSTAFSVVVPQNIVNQNPYIRLGAYNNFNGIPPYLAIGTNWSYSANAINPAKAKLLLYGTDSSNIMGMGVSSLRGLEFYRGTFPNFNFNGPIVVSKGPGNPRTTYMDTAVFIGTNWPAGSDAVPYLFVGGPISQISGDPTKAKLRVAGSSANDISGIGFSGNMQVGMEYFPGRGNMHTFYGNMALNGIAKYAANYASMYNARTLVDRGYVDSVKLAGTPQWKGGNTDTGGLYRVGNVGIGIAAATNATDKLIVNGNIKAKRVIITLQGWGDYVFDSAYNLRPLDQVADYVKQNKHLPEMQPAKQLEKDGADMGEVVKQQQVKIEELTLYIIEQNKKQQALQQQLDEQMKMIRALQQGAVK